ncbi:MAG: type 11 methyltransferase [Pedosphaera sp.]|nr:type 11 methyltransferase [Pedosphaera sp.]
MAPTNRKPNYGIDAPKVVLRFFLIGIGGLLFASCAWLTSHNGWLPGTRSLVRPLLTMGLAFLVQGAVMVWGSKVAKLRLRDKVLNAIPWRGDEWVLDVGCGHGLMLIGAAKRLRRGSAIGIDLWQQEDQAGNSPEATWRNVEAEDVTDRVELRNGDARELPFADNTFDVVLSSWALHNIYDRAERATALREIVRVLKPGGRLAIIDIRHTGEYAQILQEHKMLNLIRSRPNFLFVIPTFTLTATKP